MASLTSGAGAEGGIGVRRRSAAAARAGSDASMDAASLAAGGSRAAARRSSRKGPGDGRGRGGSGSGLGASGAGGSPPPRPSGRGSGKAAGVAAEEGSGRAAARRASTLRTRARSVRRALHVGGERDEGDREEEGEDELHRPRKRTPRHCSRLNSRVRMPKPLFLRPGRDDAARRRHPWVFSRALAGSPPGAAGEIEVRSASGALLGRGFASPRSSIAARLWRFDDGPLDAAFVGGRVRGGGAAARALRAAARPTATASSTPRGTAFPASSSTATGTSSSSRRRRRGRRRRGPSGCRPFAALFPEASILQRNDLASRHGEGLALEDELLAGERVRPVASRSGKGA